MFNSPGTSQGNFMDPDALSKIKSVDLSADFAAVTLTINGLFDDRIAQLKALKDEFDARAEVGTTLDEAKKIKEQAKAIESDVEARLQLALQKERELDDKNASYVNRLFELNIKAADQEKMDADLAKRELKLQSSIERQQADANAQSAAFAAEKAILERDREILAKQKSDFNARLDALRT